MEIRFLEPTPLNVEALQDPSDNSEVPEQTVETQEPRSLDPDVSEQTVDAQETSPSGVEVQLETIDVQEPAQTDLEDHDATIEVQEPTPPDSETQVETTESEPDMPVPISAQQLQAESIVAFIQDDWDGNYNPIVLAYPEYIRTLARNASFQDVEACERWYAATLANTEAMQPGLWLLFKMGAISVASTTEMEPRGGLKTWGPMVMCSLATSTISPRYLWDDNFCSLYVQPTSRALADLNQLDAAAYGEAFSTYQGWIYNVNNYDGCNILPASKQPERVQQTVEVP